MVSPNIDDFDAVSDLDSELDPLDLMDNGAEDILSTAIDINQEARRLAAYRMATISSRSQQLRLQGAYEQRQGWVRVRQTTDTNTGDCQITGYW